MRFLARAFAPFALALVLIAGCASSADVRSQNRESLNRLALGMSKQEVLQTMGTETVDVWSQTPPYVVVAEITNPYRTEILLDDSGHRYAVLFYYTDIKSRDGAITDDELTPLVLDEGRLIGWGWSFLQPQGQTYIVRVR